MRYLSEHDMRMQGLGDVYEGLDGNLYEWVDGVDAWGDAIGFWQGVSEPEVAELHGLGALYEAPDGTLYRVQGLAEEEAEAEAAPPEQAEEADDSKAAPVMGPGRPGQVRVGPDGKKYRWMRGRDAQGKPTGFWRRLRPASPGSPRPSQHGPSPRARQAGARPGARRPSGRKPLLKKILPFAKFATALIPGVGPAVATGLTVAGKLLKRRKGVSGFDGLGALYQAPDGSLYQVHGFAEEELGEELEGFADDEELHGFAEDEELRGFAEDEELHGAAQIEQQPQFSGEPELQGLEQGYVREDGVSGLEAYVRARPPETRWFESPSEAPELWKPLW